MTLSKTDKIRAALEFAKSMDDLTDAEFVLLDDALSELDGYVIVPVEPTEEQMILGLGWSGHAAYRKMIAPYVNGEKK